VAIKISVGDKLNVSNARFGTRQNGGQWGFVDVKPEKGYDRITAWFVNPDDAKGRQQVEVVAINSVKLGARKYTDKSGQEKWATEYSVDVTIKAAGAQQVQPPKQPNFDQYMSGSGFMDLGQVDDVNDPGLPFA